MEQGKPWYLNQSQSLGSSYLHFKNAVIEKSILDPKTRELIMVALTCALRSPHCIKEHIEGALAAGATKQEVAETLLVTAYEGAGTQLAWQKELFESYLGANSK